MEIDDNKAQIKTLEQKNAELTVSQTYLQEAYEEIKRAKAKQEAEFDQDILQLKSQAKLDVQLVEQQLRTRTEQSQEEYRVLLQEKSELAKTSALVRQ